MKKKREMVAKILLQRVKDHFFSFDNVNSVVKAMSNPFENSFDDLDYEPAPLASEHSLFITHDDLSSNNGKMQP